MFYAIKNLFDRETREFIKNILSLILVNIAGSISELFIESLLGHVSLRHLTANGFINYGAIILNIVSGVLMGTVMILSRKDGKTLDQVAQGAFSALVQIMTVLLVPAYFLAFFMIKNLVVDGLPIVTLPGINVAISLVTFRFLLANFGSLGGTILIIDKKRNLAVKWTLYYEVATLIFQALSFWGTSYFGTTAQYIGIYAVDVVLEALLLTRIIYNFRGTISFRFNYLAGLSYLKRARLIIGNDLLMAIPPMIAPVFTRAAISNLTDKEGIAAYFVGLSIIRFAGMPVGNVIYFGIQWLSESLKNKNTGEWDRKVRRTLFVAILLGVLPSLALMILGPTILKVLFGLKSTTSVMVLWVYGLSVIVSALSVGYTIQVRLLEKLSMMTGAALTAQWLISYPLFLLFLKFDNLPMAVFCGNVLSGLLIGLYFKANWNKVAMMRRSEVRHQIGSCGATASIRNIAGSDALLKAKIKNLSFNGCAMEFVRSDAIDNLLKKDSKIAGHVTLLSNDECGFSGHVRHITVIKSWWQMSGGKIIVGVQFDCPSAMLIEEVRLTIDSLKLKKVA